MEDDTYKKILFAELIPDDIDQFCEDFYLYLEDCFIETGDIELCKSIMSTLQMLDVRDDLKLAKEMFKTLKQDSTAD
ncbi:conserved hypothetical protein [Vibrio crassostreae]|nr:conserved hypothetical protein [Vibrio crassostreae]CAK3110105.1 conserved hypothetical protein [Vibrio crassostreae]